MIHYSSTYSDDTQKASSGGGGGGSSTKKQLQHSTGPTLAAADNQRVASGRDSTTPGATNQQQATTIGANINRPASPITTKQQQSQPQPQPQQQRYPVNDSNETSPTNRPVSVLDLLAYITIFDMGDITYPFACGQINPTLTLSIYSIFHVKLLACCL